MSITFLTTVGRIVWGSPSVRATKDFDGNAYPEGKGPFNFGWAVQKTDTAGITTLFGNIYGVAVQSYGAHPAIIQRIQSTYQSGFTSKDFSFKIRDGDAPLDDGTINENTKGCWVFTMSTRLPLKMGNGGGVAGVPLNAEIDPALIKCGYYVDINLSVKWNEKTNNTAGVYLNPEAIRLVGYGKEIISGQTVEQMFGTAPAPVLPAGASATPLAGDAPTPQANATGFPAQAQGLPVTAAPVATMPGLPATLPTASPSNGLPTLPGVTPHNQFVQGGNGMPALPGMPGQ